MARDVELRRHTDSDGDALTEEGVRAALEIGRRLVGGYALLVSSGAQPATQALACFACALREADPELVQEDSALAGAALRRVLERLPEDGRALAVGHSPTNEAAVLGLTDSIVEPIAKGAGVLVLAERDRTRVAPL